MFYLYGIILGIMALLNIQSCYLFYQDKQLARRGAYRIPEKRLLWSGLLGGIGAFVAMNIFRHKTQHLRFKILIPIALAINIATYVIVFRGILTY